MGQLKDFYSNSSSAIRDAETDDSSKALSIIFHGLYRLAQPDLHFPLTLSRCLLRTSLLARLQPHPFFKYQLQPEGRHTPILRLRTPQQPHPVPNALLNLLA